MHPFKQKVQNRNLELEALADRVLKLNKQMIKIIGLSSKDLEIAIGHNVIFKTRSYKITPKACCLYNGWHDVLTVLPRDNNYEHWTSCGASVFAPNSEELYQDILKEVMNVEH